MESMKKKHDEEISNWKLMYEELEKTTLENLTKSSKGKMEANHEIDELKQETERLQHNLKLREEQLEKSNLKLPQYMNEMEVHRNSIQSLNEENERIKQQQQHSLNGNESKWKKMIAAKDQ